MSENNEKIFDSPASDPEDDFWLAYGKQIIIESLPAVRSAANSVITALGFIQAIYLGMLGFGEFIPQEIPWNAKALFFIPLLFWLVSLYFCISVVMIGKMEIVLYSPEDIRDKSLKFTRGKQRALRWGFIFMALGLLGAFVLFVLRLQF
jgi:uncharacterized membrane protein YtjA (UPF0391 family)